VIALSFSREGFVEVSAARNSRDLVDAYYIARAGMAAATYQLLERRLLPRLQQMGPDLPPEPIDLGRVTGTFGDGVYEVDVQDESGKINLRFVTEEHLRQLVEVIGIPEPDATIIVESVMDWRDVDNAFRANGAEDEYYQGLPVPYKTKNGMMETVEELLLIRGVTRDYYYGHVERAPDGSPVVLYGLSRYTTVYSRGGPAVNVNYAPLPVLMSIPGMPPEAARQIYERRQVKPFATTEEINRELPLSLGPTVASALNTEQTGVYTLTASGRREGARARRVIRAVVRVDPSEARRYRILYWNENVPNL
jgi:general secretion pathway protein K